MNSKTKANTKVKTTANRKETAVTPLTKDLNEGKEYLKQLDKNHFKHIFAQNGMELLWSDTMNKTQHRIVSPKNGKPGKLFISRPLFGDISNPGIKEKILKILEKAFIKLGFDDLESIEKSLKSLSVKDNKKVDPKVTKHNGEVLFGSKEVFPVQFEMLPKIKKLESESVVNKSLEKSDPNPDIQILFKEYDKRFFGGILSHHRVEVSWSERLTSCAGITQDVNDQPIQIRLSRPLLFGKRSDLVETLLHEMIHALNYIEGLDENHGTMFHKRMNWLNKNAGANITVSHELLYENDNFIKKYRKEQNKINEEFNKAMNENKNSKTINRRNEE